MTTIIIILLLSLSILLEGLFIIRLHVITNEMTNVMNPIIREAISPSFLKKAIMFEL